MGEWEQMRYESILILGDIEQYGLKNISDLILETIKDKFLEMCKNPHYFESFNTQRTVETEISRSKSCHATSTVIQNSEWGWKNEDT